jgi:hypothetical protein
MEKTGATQKMKKEDLNRRDVKDYCKAYYFKEYHDEIISAVDKLNDDEVYDIYLRFGEVQELLEEIWIEIKKEYDEEE